MDYRAQLTTLVEIMSDARCLSEARIANLAGCDSRFFARLRSGGGCRVDTMLRVVQFFSNNWPECALWPDCIARPVPEEIAA